MQARPVGEADVDVGRRVVQATAAQRRQTLGQPAYRLVVGEAAPATVSRPAPRST